MTTTRKDPAFWGGIAVTAGLHAVLVGALWWSGHAAASKGAALSPGVFVDAQLVRFGKPRDLKFLPHKEGPQKVVAAPDALKVARSDDAKPVTEKKPEPPKPDEIDPLKKTRAELFKQMTDDDRPFAVAPEVGVGSPTGSLAGTATEAKGDPYILSLMDQIGSAWSVPTTIKDEELTSLSASMCLTIDENGKLVKFAFYVDKEGKTHRSGNSQFDSSLAAALGAIGTLPPPPPKWASLAARGLLCPEFVKQK